MEQATFRTTGHDLPGRSQSESDPQSRCYLVFGACWSDADWSKTIFRIERPNTASGPTTNVAARLSALVQGEGVILSQETRIRIGDEFNLHDLGPQALKNVSEPIRAYRLTTK